MRTVRLGALLGVAVVTTGFSLAATNCASATTITLEIRARSELCSGEGGLRLNQTGIAVTIEKKVDKPNLSPMKDFQDGCSTKAGSIGTLVITPSGPKNEEVAIRVVAALNDNSATACDTESAAKNCIITKRLVRFVEGANVPVTVIIEPECNGVECPSNLVCVKGGSCAPIGEIPIGPGDVQPDANAVEDAEGIADAEPPKDVFVPPVDAGPCSRCNAPGMTCDPTKNLCTLDCSKADCRLNACPDRRLNCHFNCLKEDNCKTTTCLDNPNACTFDCRGPGGVHCANIACDAGAKCDFLCGDSLNTCNNITMAGGDNSMNCNVVGGNDDPSCNNITCSGKCSRVCVKDAGCGTTSACTGNCGQFQQNDGGPPPDAGAPQ